MGYNCSVANRSLSTTVDGRRSGKSLLQLQLLSRKSQSLHAAILYVISYIEVVTIAQSQIAVSPRQYGQRYRWAGEVTIAQSQIAVSPHRLCLSPNVLG